MSAKHGLLMPDDKVSWYDKEISELSTDEKEQLVSDVVDSLPNDIDGLMILMGREYADPLKEKLPDDIEVWDPLEGVELFNQREELPDLATPSDQVTFEDF